MSSHYRYAVLALVLPLAAGCTHVQLRKRTPQQLRTTSEITQQQVLDNVAQMVGNEHAWPEFSNFSDGLTQVSDGASANIGLTWDARSIVSEFFGAQGGRQLVESWTMKPVTDPARLRAMAAVYHYTVYGTIPETSAYSGSLQFSQIFGQRWQEALPPPGWFCVERDGKCTEQVHCGCLVGHYCDIHVHVNPAGHAELQQLTFLIMYISTATFTENGAEAPFPSGLPPQEPTLQGPTAPSMAPDMGSRAAPSAAPTFRAAPLRPGPAKDIQSLPMGPALTPSL